MCAGDGCGGASDTPPIPIEHTDSATPPDQYLGEDPLIALEKLETKIRRYKQGEVFRVDRESAKLTDAGMVHLKGLTNLSKTKAMAARLVHVHGRTDLEVPLTR